MIVGGHEKGRELPAVADGVGKEMPTVVDVMGKEASAAADMVCKEMPIAAYPTDREMHDVADVAGNEIPMAPGDGDDEMLVDMDTEVEWREIPEYGQTAAGPPIAEEEEKEHFMTVGCDPDGDEAIGADEEWRYFTPMQQVGNVQPIEVHKRKRTCPVLDFDTENVPDDEAGLVDDNVVPHTTYDRENPVIKEGDTFEDKADFLETIRTYAIRNEFETAIEHSDKERYRARCNDDNCEWKVYAKKLHGGNTFMVLLLPSLYLPLCIFRLLYIPLWFYLYLI